MRKSPGADADYNLWVLVGQAREAMFKARERELAKYGITPRKSAALSAIHAIGDKATLAQIAQWLFREPHSVSELLDRMEEDGLVRRVKDLERRNRVRIEVTEKGLEAYRQSLKRVSIHKIMSCLSDEERQQLGSALKKLRDRALRAVGDRRKIIFPPDKWTSEPAKL